jgi:hypothetical protein
MLSLSALGCLASCSSGGSSGGHGGGGGPQAKPYFYTSDGSETDSSIFSYPLTASGSAVAPTATLNLASGSFIMGIKSNGTNLFVLSRPGYGGVSTITCSVYTALNGVLTLVRSFTDAFGAQVEDVSGGFAVDSSGKVYVGLQDGTIAIYNASASGTVQPDSSFKVGTNYINNLAFDAAGNLFVVISGGRGILYEYAAGLANTTPIRTVQILNFETVSDIALDASGDVFLTGMALANDPSLNTGQIAEYVPGGSTPSETIQSSTLIAPTAGPLTSTGFLYTQGWISSASDLCTYLSYPLADAAPTTLFSTPVSCDANYARMAVQ